MPRFGYDTIFGTNGAWPLYIFGVRANLGEEADVTELGIYTNYSGYQIQGALYSDGLVGGISRPINLIAVTEIGTTVVGGWARLLFTSPVRLAPGRYWLLFQYPSASIITMCRYSSVLGSKTIAANKDQNLIVPFPNPYPTPAGETEDWALSAYAEYSLTGLTANADGPYVAAVDNPTIQFIGSASGGTPPYSWFWNFGDGATSIEQSPVHIYPAIEGTYTATLTVTDSIDNTATSTATVTINPTPPLVVNSDGPYSGSIDNPTIQFLGSASGGKPPYTWLWNFGDGGTNTAQNPLHTYPAIEATYAVTLIVTDASGNMATAQTTTTITITVTPKYTAITGPDGTFALIVEAGIYDIIISKLGYEPVTIANVDTSASDLLLAPIALSQTPPTPQHTRVWLFVHSLTRVSARWDFPLIEAYDQAKQKTSI